jgi:UDP-N-acetylglucosamine diphosphorylase/glucosamine-1-phosphate N-acetyltransferase
VTIYLYDDAAARQFEPFALTRPVADLRAGTELVRHRWERACGAGADGLLVARHLALFSEFGSPAPITAGPIPRGSLLVNARFAPALADIGDADAWSNDDRVAAVRLPVALEAATFASGDITLEQLVQSGSRIANVNGWWLDHVWDFLRFLPEMLVSDLAGARTSRVPELPFPPVIVGRHPVVIEADVTIAPQVVIDTTDGPVLVRSNASIASFTHLVGPCVVGNRSRVGSGRIAGCSIGEDCRVQGDVSLCIFTGHANKGHEGFVGHSILGRWVNLGASTVTSNLKNTYGDVQLWTPAGMTNTGLQFVGTLLGDHAKTAIGTRLTTGTVVGAGASVVGDTMSPKVVPPFAWGMTGEQAYDLDRFLAVAGRVMRRRGVELDANGRAHLSAAYHARWRTDP